MPKKWERIANAVAISVIVGLSSGVACHAIQTSDVCLSCWFNQ